MRCRVKVVLALNAVKSSSSTNPWICCHGHGVVGRKHKTCKSNDTRLAQLPFYLLYKVLEFSYV
jgi:hypothetical protein